MREIKFRGKRIDNGLFVYGYYFVSPLTDENSGVPAGCGWHFLSDEVKRHCIANENGVVYVVDEKTVSEYTGLKDKNGKEIYEGDIVNYRSMGNIPYRKAQIRILGGGTTADALETKIDTIDGYIYPLSNEKEFPITKSEVIGNIYENPELLK